MMRLIPPRLQEHNRSRPGLQPWLLSSIGALASVAALAPAAAAAPADYSPTIGQPHPHAIGSHTMAAILVNFADNPIQPFSTSDVDSALFTGTNSTSQYFRTASFGKLTFTGKYTTTGDVYDWVTVPAYLRKDCSPQNLLKIGKAANKAVAAATGKDILHYDNYLDIFPRQDNCINPNNGTVLNGETFGNVAFINSRHNSNFKGVDDHELAHELGASHAQDVRCYSASGKTILPALRLDNGCYMYAYGDPFDPMGKGRLTLHSPIDFDAINKARLGWLNLSNLKTITHDSTVTIAPDELPSDKTQLVRIPFEDTSGHTAYAYLDYRQPLGLDAKIPSSSALFSGVSIRVAGALRRFRPTNLLAYSYLIDTRPETKTMKDAQLTAGRTYRDKATGISISTLETSPQGAKVRIKIAPS